MRRATPLRLPLPGLSWLKPRRICLRYLPSRERVIHSLPDDQLIGPDGEKYEIIGEEVTEQLDVIPADVIVIEHVRLKYAVKGKEELGIKIAPLPPQPIAKSMASSGLLAHIVQAKYCHHLPLYRQEAIWKGLDIDISRGSMCRWLVQLGNEVQPIVDEIFEQMTLLPYIQADETKVTVINEKSQPQKPSHTGYMWVYNNTAGTIYEYKHSREGRHAKERLDEFSGYVQSDAYGGYNQLFADGNRVSVGCWAHARRKFIEVIKPLEKANKKRKKDTMADAFIKKIADLYKIESEIKEKGLLEEQIKAERQLRATPILNDIKTSLDEIVLKTPPKSLLGKAVAYALNNWAALNRYIEHGQLDIDNNDTERRIKPFTIGRKNWLFSGNTKGAETGANLFTLVENAKRYNLKVFDYLKYVFERISTAKSDKDYEQLTPKFAQEFVPKLKPDKKNQVETQQADNSGFQKNP